MAATDWTALVGDGTIRRLSLDVGQINAAFAGHPDPRAAERALADLPGTIVIDNYATLASIPQVGAVTLGEAEDANLRGWLETASTRSLSRGAGYMRGGIFDRIQLIQDDVRVLFHDRDHRRLNRVAASGAPELTETDLFRVPAEAGFDPTRPWRLQFLVSRDVATTEKVFTTFDLGWQLSAPFLRTVAAPEAVEDGAAAALALWPRIWWDKRVEIAGLAVLTAAFFFQAFLTRSARATPWFRMGFLSVTLVFLGWHANAQISVVNLKRWPGSLMSGFSWDAFRMEP